ncbi:MAG: hypothetical protein M1826_000053 [Phylliscum demangeonii]|nr:MAG: hypothetical protein M1826_000053 [Phylliscum demangeonii]
MPTPRFEVYDGPSITDDLLVQASQLFNEHYGVWDRKATQAIPNIKAGDRVKLGRARLRAQCVFDPRPGMCTYVRVVVDGQLVGNVFAARWWYGSTHEAGEAGGAGADQRRVCWITQLVVHRDFRRQRLASQLLAHLRESGDTAYGVASSHPAACMATAAVFGLLAACPVDYIKSAKPYGACFSQAGGPGHHTPAPDDNGDEEEAHQPREIKGAVSLLDTAFFVDHGEPLEALGKMTAEDWPLGELVDGCEFVVLLPPREMVGSGLAPTRASKQ